MKVKIRECPEQFSDYVVENGPLYRNLGRKADDEDYFPSKLCVPSPGRVRVLRECHDAPTSGHLGVRKTVFLDCIKGISGPFPDQTKAAGKMLARVTNEPFDILCAKFVDPLPRSKHGNTVLLVFHDIFSRYEKLLPPRSRRLS